MKYTPEEQRRIVNLTADFLHKNIEKTEIEGLREVIIFHEWRYYVLHEPLISDSEYDALFKKLRILEEERLVGEVA